MDSKDYVMNLINNTEPQVDVTGMSLYKLTLPKGKNTKDLLMTAKNRLEMFCQDRQLSNIGGQVESDGISFVMRDDLIHELVSFIRISGALISKKGFNRRSRRALGG